MQTVYVLYKKRKDYNEYVGLSLEDVAKHFKAQLKKYFKYEVGQWSREDFYAFGVNGHYDLQVWKIKKNGTADIDKKASKSAEKLVTEWVRGYLDKNNLLEKE